LTHTLVFEWPILLRQIAEVEMSAELGMCCAISNIREQIRSRKIGSRPVASSRQNSEFEILQSEDQKKIKWFFSVTILLFF